MYRDGEALEFTEIDDLRVDRHAGRVQSSPQFPRARFPADRAIGHGHHESNDQSKDEVLLRARRCLRGGCMRVLAAPRPSPF